jgi:hypothetical protein
VNARLNAIQSRTTNQDDSLGITSRSHAATLSTAPFSPALQEVVRPRDTEIDAVRQQNEDLARMYEWFDRVGYDADVVGLRQLYPEVNWHRFSDWAGEQDWSAIAVPATVI